MISVTTGPTASRGQVLLAITNTTDFTLIAKQRFRQKIMKINSEHRNILDMNNNNTDKEKLKS